MPSKCFESLHDLRSSERQDVGDRGERAKSFMAWLWLEVLLQNQSRELRVLVSALAEPIRPAAF